MAARRPLRPWRRSHTPQSLRAPIFRAGRGEGVWRDILTAKTWMGLFIRIETQHFQEFQRTGERSIVHNTILHRPPISRTPFGIWLFTHRQPRQPPARSTAFVDACTYCASRKPGGLEGAAAGARVRRLCSDSDFCVCCVCAGCLCGLPVAVRRPHRWKAYAKKKKKKKKN